MTDKPSTPDGVKFDGSEEDVEGHKVGHPGGKPLELGGEESGPEGTKFDVGDDDQDVEGHKK